MAKSPPYPPKDKRPKRAARKPSSMGKVMSMAIGKKLDPMDYVRPSRAGGKATIGKKPYPPKDSPPRRRETLPKTPNRPYGGRMTNPPAGRRPYGGRMTAPKNPNRLYGGRMIEPPVKPMPRAETERPSRRQKPMPKAETQRPSRRQKPMPKAVVQKPARKKK